MTKTFEENNFYKLNSELVLNTRILVPLIDNNGVYMLNFSKFTERWKNIKNNLILFLTIEFVNDEKISDDIMSEAIKNVEESMTYKYYCRINTIENDDNEIRIKYLKSSQCKISDYEDIIEQIHERNRDNKSYDEYNTAIINYCRKRIVELEHEQDLEEDEENN
jgi:hypothetical protein